MEYKAHDIKRAPDVDGKERDAIVFHLRPAGSVAPDRAIVEPLLAPELGKRARSAGAGFGSPEMNRRVEQAAIDFVKAQYERNGWTVISVEINKVGYDLLCTRGAEEEHVEVKGVQGTECCFIMTRGEVRNALIDHRHITCVVTEALTALPKMRRITKQELEEQFVRDPIAYRVQPKST
jgi:hypothetical protein